MGSKHPLLLEGMHSDHEYFPTICAIVGGYLLHVLKAAIDLMHNVTKLDARQENFNSGHFELFNFPGRYDY
jgi:hypothetical protein